MSKEIFEYDELPENVQEVLQDFDENTTDPYKESDRIIKKLNEIGWTGDYGLDGILCDFKKNS